MYKDKIVKVDKPVPEYIKVYKSKKAVTFNLNIWNVVDGEFIVSIIPSLSLTGYGKTKDEAMEMLKEIAGDYFDTLIKQDKGVIDLDLADHGWTKNKARPKNFEGPYITREGILEQFDLPKDTILEQESLMA